MAKPVFSEGAPGTPRAPEGITAHGGLLARRVSAVARVRGVRNAHIGRLGSIFFTTNKFGQVMFFPKGGRMLINELFIKQTRPYTIPSSRI